MVWRVGGQGDRDNEREAGKKTNKEEKMREKIKRTLLVRLLSDSL